nr:MAG TPA: hypothetical protein [Caudoviricetes sp.]
MPLTLAGIRTGTTKMVRASWLGSHFLTQTMISRLTISLTFAVGS